MKKYPFLVIIALLFCTSLLAETDFSLSKHKKIHLKPIEILMLRNTYFSIHDLSWLFNGISKKGHDILFCDTKKAKELYLIVIRSDGAWEWYTKSNKYSPNAVQGEKQDFCIIKSVLEFITPKCPYDSKSKSVWRFDGASPLLASQPQSNRKQIEEWLKFYKDFAEDHIKNGGEVEMQSPEYYTIYANMVLDLFRERQLPEGQKDELEIKFGKDFGTLPTKTWKEVEGLLNPESLNEINTWIKKYESTNRGN